MSAPRTWKACWSLRSGTAAWSSCMLCDWLSKAVTSSLKLSGSGEGSSGGMRRSASTLERMAELLLPRQHLTVVILLGAWRALAVGTLHAYHSVRIELVMSTYTDAASHSQRANEEAGALMATTDLLAMLLLGALGPLVTRRVGLRPLLVGAPLLGLAACLVLIEQQLSRQDEQDAEKDWSSGLEAELEGALVCCCGDA